MAVDDTFAEAFPMTAARAIVTADTAGVGRDRRPDDVRVRDERDRLRRRGRDRAVAEPDETPDGRPGVSVLVFAFSRDALEKALANRVGQCVMTCPTTACYNGLPLGEKTVNVGGKLRYFGDGWQISKRLEGRRYWRVPVMDGEFTCEESLRHDQGGRRREHHPARVPSPPRPSRPPRPPSRAMRAVPDVILPFPGGIARSGSKVGSKYKKLRASTNTAFAPTLRGLVRTALPPEVRCVYEIVIDGLTLEAVERATAAGVRAGCLPGVVAVTAGNYGGKLGPVPHPAP